MICRALIEQNDDFRKKEVETGRNHQALKLEMKEVELSHEDVIRNLRKVMLPLDVCYASGS